jgi:hypothetical protein
MTDYWKPEPELLSSLDDAIPRILASQRDDGQFGTAPWISTDQNVLLALATAWSLEESRYFGDEAVLSAIVQGGHALVGAQDGDGMFTFRKKDHSTWGQIYMPWVYSRWARAYWLTREAFGADDRSRWDEALTLGFGGISETCLDRVHNIPTHDCMGLYFAGIALGREDWKEQAVRFSHQVVDAQSEHGWWPEHDGPVVAYNFVYVDALGTLYTMCKDDRILGALDRAARFHSAFAYPDGSMVETVDGRNWYHDTIRPGNPGFSHTPQGRGFLAQQHARIIAALPTTERKSIPPFDPDYAATMLLHSAEGELEPTAASSDEHTYRMGDLAAVYRRRPWFFCANAFRQDPHGNRWGQDWQNFVSVYHDEVGLVLGGGNTKLQPLWSNFSLGDVSRLNHTPGDEDPVFLAEGIQHIPDKVIIEQAEKNLRVRLTYGETECEVSVLDLGDDQLGISYSCEDDGPIEGHLTLMPGFGNILKLSTGDAIPLGEQPFAWSVPGQAGFVEHRGWRLLLPSNIRVEWTALPHDPYKKGGEPEAKDGRIVVVMPFGGERKKYEMVLQIVR